MSLKVIRLEKFTSILEKSRSLVIQLIQRCKIPQQAFSDGTEIRVIPNRRKNRVDVILNAIRYSTAAAWGIP